MIYAYTTLFISTPMPRLPRIFCFLVLMSLSSAAAQALTVGAYWAFQIEQEAGSNYSNFGTFSEAVNVQEPFAFRGGDLGWRKLSDIPSMFSQIIPSLAAGDTGKVQSNSGLHLVHLAEARGLERLVEQTDVRHILLTPNEVLGDEAAQALILSLKERIEGGEDFAELAKEYSDDIGSAQEGG